MTLITHNLQGEELKPISCAQMQDLFCDLLINLRFIHSTPEGEHMHVFCARGNVCVVCVCVCVGGGGVCCLLSRILHTRQQMCSSGILTFTSSNLCRNSSAIVLLSDV